MSVEAQGCFPTVYLQNLRVKTAYLVMPAADSESLRIVSSMGYVTSLCVYVCVTARAGPLLGSTTVGLNACVTVFCHYYI